MSDKGSDYGESWHRHGHTRRVSLDQLITDTEAAIAKLDRFGDPVRQQIATRVTLAYRLEVLEEARDSLR